MSCFILKSLNYKRGGNAMMTLDKETAIRKIAEMPIERVSKVLIFMAGMEAEHIIDEKSGTEKQHSLSSRRSAT